MSSLEVSAHCMGEPGASKPFSHCLSGGFELGNETSGLVDKPSRGLPVWGQLEIGRLPTGA